MALGGNLTTLTIKTLGDYEGLGRGNIDPAQRSDVDAEKVQMLFGELADGIYNVPVRENIFASCFDGRTMADGTRLHVPNGAGGTFSLIYARTLVPGSRYDAVSNDLELTSDMTADFKQRGLPMGVHGAHGDDCGCGACKKVRGIFELIDTYGASIRVLAEDHGVKVDDSVHRIITGQAKFKLENDFFVPDRPSLLQAAVDNSASYEQLIGEHLELVAALNTRAGTRIDRSAIRAKYGPGYDIFPVDAWALPTSAEVINESGAEAESKQLVAAMAYYNFATAALLGGPSLGFLVVR